MRLQFAGVRLRAGDSITVTTPDGATSWSYTDAGPHGHGRFWSFSVPGDTAVVQLRAGPGTGPGFQITAITHGTMDLQRGRPAPPSAEVVCGNDGRQDVACHPDKAAAYGPLARLIFNIGANAYYCTGWRVQSPVAGAMLTNGHCFNSQAEVETVEAAFNFQGLYCSTNPNDSAQVAASTVYAGARLLKTRPANSSKTGYDYTLFTLYDTAPASLASWGYLVGSAAAALANTQIYFPQHPGGGLKKIGVFEDAARTQVCRVNAVRQSFTSTPRNSQVAYACDSEGGSSGSPILDAASKKVLALHHYGGVGGNACLNSGTDMSLICTDAGRSLLSCN